MRKVYQINWEPLIYNRSTNQHPSSYQPHLPLPVLSLKPFKITVYYLHLILSGSHRCAHVASCVNGLKASPAGVLWVHAVYLIVFHDKQVIQCFGAVCLLIFELLPVKAPSAPLGLNSVLAINIKSSSAPQSWNKTPGIVISPVNLSVIVLSCSIYPFLLYLLLILQREINYFDLTEFSTFIQFQWSIQNMPILQLCLTADTVKRITSPVLMQEMSFTVSVTS